jgi:hypothetical protein
MDVFDADVLIHATSVERPSVVGTVQRAVMAAASAGRRTAVRLAKVAANTMATRRSPSERRGIRKETRSHRPHRRSHQSFFAWLVNRLWMAMAVRNNIDPDSTTMVPTA